MGLYDLKNRIVSFSRYSHHRGGLLGPWTESNSKCALQTGYLFLKVMLCSGFKFLKNTVKCWLAVCSLKELLEVWLQLLDPLECYKVNVLMLLARYLKYPQTQLMYFMGSNGLVAIVFNVLYSLFDQISIWSQLPYQVCFYMQHQVYFCKKILTL